MEDFERDITAINRISAVPTILDIVCRITGMGFAAVARVTEDRWIACQVRDDIGFGLTAGGELDVKTTICDEIRQSKTHVVINHVAIDDIYCSHHTPAQYGLQSYISMPILLKDGTFFGTLCAIDPRPANVNTPEIIGTFKLFAELIGTHLNALDQMASTNALLEEEKKTSELREQFIAVLGHDLRNPLGAISSGAEILKMMSLEEDGLEVADMILACSKRMTDLIENLMDFARGRLGGGFSLNYSHDKSIEILITHCVEEMRLSFPDRIITISCAVQEPISCDSHRIAQLLSNLLGNAITYGAKDKPITVAAENKNGLLELSVSNAGAPIPLETIEKLFEPFSRGGDRPHQQGLGLGLYIAAQIAAAHGGNLSVASTEEQTRFTLRMPMEYTA